MGTYITRAKKLFAIYYLSIFIFCILAFALSNFFSEGNRYIMITLVSFFAWGYGVLEWYLEAKRMGNTDKIPYYNLKRNPFRVFLIGVVTMIAISIFAGLLGNILIWILKLLAFVAVPTNEVFSWKSALTDNLYEIIIKIFFSPLYWMARPLGNNFLNYVIVGFTYPISSMLGYTVGLYKSNIGKSEK